MFNPDIFSRNNPIFEPISMNNMGVISHVINTYYSSLGNPILSGEKLSGLEINSKNYKIKIGNRTYALKQVTSKTNIVSFCEQLLVSQQLIEQGVLFPKIVMTDNNELFSCENENTIWVLTEFVEGTYYSGCKSDFLVISQALGVMQSKLEKIGSKNLPLSTMNRSWNWTNDILCELFERKDEFILLFPEKECDVLLREFEFLQRNQFYVSDQIDCINHDVASTHIDIHPHNILINNSYGPIFVDVDSLQIADRIQSMAFATYKLARQHVVYEKIQDSQNEIAHATKIFVDRLLFHAKLEEINSSDFPVAAIAEILRRIAIIIDLNIHEKNQDWNPVLHMHLTALREIPLLFANFFDNSNAKHM